MGKLDGKRSGTVIFDDLAFKLTPSERIIFGIIHRFSGYALGECRLKPNKIADIAGVSRSTVYNVTNSLCDLGMIEVVKHQKSNGAYFRALKVVKDRLDDVEGVPVEDLANREMNHMKNDLTDDRRSVFEFGEMFAGVMEEAKQEHYGSESINDLFDFWLAEVETPISNRVKANRRAAWNLATKHSKEELERMIKLVKVARYNEYAPAIADFVDLQGKWQQLALWAEKRAHAALMKSYEAMSIEDRVKFKQQNPSLAKVIDAKRKAI